MPFPGCEALAGGGRLGSALPRADAGGGARVLLVSIDGLRPDALWAAPARNLLGLACRGAHAWEARTVTPSMTVPGHASMITGLTPASHGFTWDDARSGFIDAPTILGVAR